MAGRDTKIDIAWRPELPPPSGPQPIGAGHLILVARELSGLSQRALAAEIGSSQPWLATLETGNGMPTVRTLLRVARAAGLELVLGLIRPRESRPDPDAIQELGFALLGTLNLSDEDGLADYLVPGARSDAQPPQVQVPHPQPPPDAEGPASGPEAAPAANEY